MFISTAQRIWDHRTSDYSWRLTNRSLSANLSLTRTRDGVCSLIIRGSYLCMRAWPKKMLRVMCYRIQKKRDGHFGTTQGRHPSPNRQPHLKDTICYLLLLTARRGGGGGGGFLMLVVFFPGAVRTDFA